MEEGAAALLHQFIIGGPGGDDFLLGVEHGQVLQALGRAGEMAAYPNFHGPAVVVFLAVLHVGQALIAGEGKEQVLSGHHQVLGDGAHDAVDEGFGGLHEDGQGVAVVAPLPVGEALQAVGGGLVLHVEDAVAGQVHGGHHGDVLGVLMGYVGAHHRVHDGSLVAVDGDVDLLGADELHDGVGHTLGEGAVQTAGVAPVQVAQVIVGLGLAGGIIDVGEVIRPLIQGVGVALADLVLLLAPLGLNGEIGRIRVALHAQSGGREAALGNDVHHALFHLDIFHHDKGGKAGGRLVGMGAAAVQQGAALYAGVEHEDGRIAEGAFQLGHVVAEPAHVGQGVGDHNRLLIVALIVEAVAGHRRQHQRQRQAQ